MKAKTVGRLIDDFKSTRRIFDSAMPQNSKASVKSSHSCLLYDL